MHQGTQSPRTKVVHGGSDFPCRHRVPFASKAVIVRTGAQVTLTVKTLLSCVLTWCLTTGLSRSSANSSQGDTSKSSSYTICFQYLSASQLVKCKMYYVVPFIKSVALSYPTVYRNKISLKRRQPQIVVGSLPQTEGDRKASSN